MNVCVPVNMCQSTREVLRNTYKCEKIVDLVVHTQYSERIQKILQKKKNWQKKNTVTDYKIVMRNTQNDFPITW